MFYSIYQQKFTVNGVFLTLSDYVQIPGPLLASIASCISRREAPAKLLSQEPSSGIPCTLSY